MTASAKIINARRDRTPIRGPLRMQWSSLAVFDVAGRGQALLLIASHFLCFAGRMSPAI